jgi:hypothetical protein
MERIWALVVRIEFFDLKISFLSDLRSSAFIRGFILLLGFSQP